MIDMNFIPPFHAGLSDEQLQRVFNILENTPNPSGEYEKWIRTISPELIDASIKSYTGVNLDNPHQRETILFPVLICMSSIFG